MLNPRWLQTFCSLVEIGSFTRTAEKLFMTQSGVSQHVRKLEDQLGVELLIREHKAFSLTEAGRRLYSDGRALLVSLENLQVSVGEDPSHAGEVRIMSPGSVGLSLYPQLLDLQVDYPKLVIDYRFAPNDDIEAAVAEDAIDIGLMTRPPERPEIRGEPLGEEPLLLVMPVEYAPTWQNLTTLGFIDHPDGHYHARKLISDNFEEFESTHQLTKRGFSNQIGLILEPVSRGLGFTVLPRYAVEAFPNPAAIASYPLAKPVSEPLFLVGQARKQRPRRVGTITDKIRKLVDLNTF